ncbi:hypothetical protein VB776_16215 [Arcicella sp. DC2W]|uniref:Phage protein n=1 Tax=Arcicella gelida TaxID=2984195 RepID=A0ABU5S8D9_9BACT|nr:hypothetical protein [Arcicella sp. DC2W]MEA5404478.1 hypothetical protein [Arcicella sp. DC2W]
MRISELIKKLLDEVNYDPYKPHEYITAKSQIEQHYYHALLLKVGELKVKQLIEGDINLSFKADSPKVNLTTKALIDFANYCIGEGYTSNVSEYELTKFILSYEKPTNP